MIRLDDSEALCDHTISVKLLRDGQPAGVGLDGKFRVGHPAVINTTDPLFVPQAWTFNQVRFDEPGDYEWVIEIDGAPYESLRCALRTFEEVGMA